VADPVINISSAQLSIEGNAEPLEISKVEVIKDEATMLTKDEKMELAIQKTLAAILDVPIILINEALKVMLLTLPLYTSLVDVDAGHLQ
jgi:hypothetical protein